MTLTQRIEALSELGKVLESQNATFFNICNQAYQKNQWFTIENTQKAVQSIREKFLTQSTLESWADHYEISDKYSKRIGLVLAGNIPLVGWHDVMCCFVSGHKARLKYSSKDDVLIPFLLQQLEEVDTHTKFYFEQSDKLTNIDAVIATGGDTAATHFQYYFGQYPNIIRGNRNSVAVLSGNERATELEGLVDDVFQYFGLGCRSVSKIFIPRGYDLGPIFEASMKYSSVIDHTKYKNNFDYNHSIYLLGQQKFLTNNFLIILEDQNVSSRIACLHYEYYDDMNDLESKLDSHKDQLQCIGSNLNLENHNTTSLGTCQKPTISDYADNIDTMSFLTSLT